MSDQSAFTVSGISGGTVTSVQFTTDSPSALTISGTNPIVTNGIINLTSKGNLLSIQYLSSGTAATYTKNTAASSILVQCLGGGGGGGGAAGSSTLLNAAGGGGAGGYCFKYITSAAATYTYTIGAGGAGGIAGNNPGTAGGNTTFSTLTANGGSGGAPGYGADTNAFDGINGGNGGTSSGGDVNFQGGNGGYGVILVSSGATSGAGGDSYLCAGANSLFSSNTDGNNALGNSGAGGSGSAMNAQNANHAGGHGGSGLIIVYEYA